jgi:DNA polymerase-3 subunit beta
MELLQNLRAEEISFYFSQPNKPAVIMPTSQASDEDILLLIMPILLS